MGSSIRIYRQVAEIPRDFGPSALTIGNFDGAHIGHQEVFRRVVRISRRRGWKPAAVTFDPHPAKVVAPDRAPRLLSTPTERCRWMAEAGIEQAVILPFTPEFSGMSPEDFVRHLLAERFQAKLVLIGWNFRFGRNQAGDTDFLQGMGKEYGFTTEIVQGVKFRGLTVSSSEIRRLLASGRVAAANRLLGRPYGIEGVVVPGFGIGSKKTVPTLNLRTGAEVLPARGVYITRTVDLNSGVEYPSVTNVGYRPTFKGDNLTIETHVLGSLGGASPQRIQAKFFWRLRGERRFPDAESLKAQILRDIRRARAYFRRTERWMDDAAHDPRS